MADETDRDLEIEDANAAGWLMPEGDSLQVRDPDTGECYLLTVRRVTS